jgi:thiol-disulfide isomerase/thioredoxin
MAMKKGVVLFFAAFWIVSFFMTSVCPLLAATTPSPSDCPSCSSFGVQRFPAKKEAPPFTLKSLDGGFTTLSTYRGKPVLLFFWGSWCESCKEDIVLLEKFAEGKKDQISIFTVVVDGEREKRIRQIAEKYKITLPVLMVFKEKVIDTYEIRMVPMVVVINQEGFMVGKIIGQRDWSKPEAWSVVKELCGLH